MIEFLSLLAQNTNNTTPSQQGGSALWQIIVPMILAMAVFIFISSRGKAKERQKFQDMLNSLKRNDRVQTIGGIYGTVWEVKDGEVVLKVDESNNTKLRFNRSAIKEVITPDGAVQKQQ